MLCFRAVIILAFSWALLSCSQHYYLLALSCLLLQFFLLHILAFVWDLPQSYLASSSSIPDFFWIADILCLFYLKFPLAGASLVAQWLRICLLMQGTRVRALVWEDPTCSEQLGQWATITEPAHLEPVLHNKRGRDSERPAHRDEEWPPLASTRESPHRNKDPTQPKINKLIN